MRGIDGLLRPIFTHSQASTGARVMIATEFTDWNQAFGQTQPPTFAPMRAMARIATSSRTGMAIFSRSTASFLMYRARTSAKVMIASRLTAFSHFAAINVSPNSRSTILSDRKLKELPACSKNIQNSTLKAKMISNAITLSRATEPSRMPSTSSMTPSPTNIAVSTHCSELAPIDSRK